MIVLASTSPQRRLILEQLRIPFEAVAPAYEEEPGGDPIEHAAGKARSVDGGHRPVLGVDTIVACNGEVLGKPRDATDAERMLELLSGRTHEVVSGLCLRTPAWEELHHASTRVTFRRLTPGFRPALEHRVHVHVDLPTALTEGLGQTLAEPLVLDEELVEP